MKTSGTEQKTQKQTHQLQSFDLLTKEPKTHIGRKTVFSTNGIGKTGYPPIEE
jgi:hypothetical protein